MDIENELVSGGKPSTRLPPGRLVEHSYLLGIVYYDFGVILRSFKKLQKKHHFLPPKVDLTSDFCNAHDNHRPEELRLGR